MHPDSIDYYTDEDAKVLTTAVLYGVSSSRERKLALLVERYIDERNAAQAVVRNLYETSNA